MEGIVKGFRDILPEEAIKREKVKEILIENFKKYSFLPIETPTIEYLELIKQGNEFDEVVSDVYRLQDKGGRNLGLRYEFTFQLARLINENKTIKLPFRRYQIGNVFRDEPISASRFREFTQADADIIGDSSIKADAECLALASSILKDLGIKAEIQINNRKLLNSILENLGIKNKEFVLREIDKIDKQGEDLVKADLNKFIDKRTIIDLFRILSKPLSNFKKHPGYQEINELMSLCKVYKIKTRFNAGLARGLSYYTGNVFEIKTLDKNKLTISAGGRYDNKINNIPCVGISFGLDRLTELAKTEKETIKALIISINQDKKAIEIAEKLRKNISCFIMNKISKALDFANSYSIPFVIFLGKEEIKKKKLKLRDMKTGKEEYLSEKELIERLK